MALCHSLMFFVVVAINLTPGISQWDYKVSVDGKEYVHGSTVTVLEGDTITIACKFVGGGTRSLSRVWSELNNESYSDTGTMTFIVKTSNDVTTRCTCIGKVGVKWIVPVTIVKLQVKSRPRTLSTASPARKKEQMTTRPIADKITTASTPRPKTLSTASPVRKNKQVITRPIADKITTASTPPNNKPSYTSGKPTQKNNRLDVEKQDQVSSKLTTTGPTGDRSGRDLKTASTPRKPKPVQVENNNDLIVIIVPASICVVLALVVTLVIVVLVLRRKTASRNIQDKGEPTYAVVQDVETKRDYIGTNIDETYAVVNKKQKANKKDVGPQDFNPLDETYAAVNKNKKTNKGDTVASTDPVSNPKAQPKGMNFNMAALREEADGLAVYKKVQKEHGDFSTEDKTQTNSTEGSGRYLNEDGLVYVTVELNPVAPKATIKPATIVRDERYEPVEYSTIVPGQGAKKDETNDEA